MKMQTLNSYSTWIFDCDGVLLDSNGCKANAFYEAALPYGKKVAEEIRMYHQNNGGISRFKKFRHVFEHILGKTDYEQDYERMVLDFSKESREQLMRCRIVPGIDKLLEQAPKQTRLYVISGAEEEELRWCLEYHGLAKHFLGIYGSPKSKPEILNAMKLENKLAMPAIFFGDSRYDMESAIGAGCDFAFVYGCTDYANWHELVKKNNVAAVRDFNEILSCTSS